MFYHKYDVNKDGRIDSNELRLLFNDMNEQMSNEEFRSLMAQMDKDKSGYIGLLFWIFFAAPY